MEGKLVLVGDTSEMSHDIFETPVGEVYGIEIIADTVATMMKQQPIRPAPFAFEALVMLILLLAFFAISQLKKFENLVFLLVIVVYSAINIYFYIYHGLVFSLSYPTGCLLSQHDHHQLISVHAGTKTKNLHPRSILTIPLSGGHRHDRQRSG